MTGIWPVNRAAIGDDKLRVSAVRARLPPPPTITAVIRTAPQLEPILTLPATLQSAQTKGRKAGTTKQSETVTCQIFFWRSGRSEGSKAESQGGEGCQSRTALLWQKAKE